VNTVGGRNHEKKDVEGASKKKFERDQGELANRDKGQQQFFGKEPALNLMLCHSRQALREKYERIEGECSGKDNKRTQSSGSDQGRKQQKSVGGEMLAGGVGTSQVWGKITKKKSALGAKKSCDGSREAERKPRRK